jgi:hypothetical protein
VQYFFNKCLKAFRSFVFYLYICSDILAATSNHFESTIYSPLSLSQSAVNQRVLTWNHLIFTPKVGSWSFIMSKTETAPGVIFPYSTQPSIAQGPVLIIIKYCSPQNMYLAYREKMTISIQYYKNWIYSFFFLFAIHLYFSISVSERRPFF